MKKSVKFNLSNDVRDTSSVFDAVNESNEVYLNLDQISQFSFSKDKIRFTLSGLELGGCFVIEFSEDGMGEFHRIKREVEEYMGIKDVAKEMSIKDVAKEVAEA
jgi:hypothetical protein